MYRVLAGVLSDHSSGQSVKAGHDVADVSKLQLLASVALIMGIIQVG
jgi:hypothetical protein